MKKLTYAIVSAAVLVGFTACGSKTKAPAPGESAKNAAELCHKGNYDDFITMVVFADTVEVEAAKKEAKKVLKTYHKPKVEEKGELKEIVVAEETVAPSGKEAEVVLDQSYQSGEREVIVYDMILDDNNVWKVKSGKDREVWKTRTPEGHHVAFKLKYDEDKEVFKEHMDGDREFVKVKDGENKDVLKIKEDGQKEVIKVIEKDDETVIKVKVDGEKEVERIEK